MKRAEPHVIRSASHKMYVVADDIYNVGSIFNFLDSSFIYQKCEFMNGERYLSMNFSKSKG